MDAWDVDPSDVAKTYAKRHLEAFEAAKGKLCETNFILIDDTDVGGGGKGSLLVPHLLDQGYITLFTGRQTLLYKGDITCLWKTI